MAWTRLYLGVHTPVDLALGACVGLASWALWRVAALPLAGAVSSPPLLPMPAGASPLAAAAAEAAGSGLPGLAGLAAAHLLALCTYPRPLEHSTSYEYAVIFLGAALGGMAGLNEHLSPVASWLAAPGSRLRAALGAAPGALRSPLSVVLMGFAVSHMPMESTLGSEVL